MSYLILSQNSEAYAASLSAALYALSAHASTSGTAYAVGWQTNPTTGEVALRLGGDQYLQPTADIAAFVALLPIPQAEADSLVASLDAARGTRLAYVDMLPGSLQAQLVDHFGPVNINTDDSATLQTLTGIGSTLAQSIIDGRSWTAATDLAQVAGISAAMVADWQSNPGLEVDVP